MPSTAGHSTEAPWFEDVTEAKGLRFVHDAGPTGSYFLPQIIGSGAALFDYDGDGRLDVYLLQNAGPGSRVTNRLFHQEPDGTFRDVSAGSGLDIDGHNMGVAVGDVNNDGWPDVLVTGYRYVRLFLNNGGTTFTDRTAAAGLDNPLWGTSASFLDFDRDGWLDLVVVNYLAYDPALPCTGRGGRPDYCHPTNFSGSLTKLFRNRGRLSEGAACAFEDVTARAGLGQVASPGLGVLAADFNGDGWPDIFVANDAAANRLWINQRNGTFREEALSRSVAYNILGQPQGNMGVAWGDIDGDGLFDLFVTHLTDETHTLWKQVSPGQFLDRTGAAGLARPLWPGTGFGTVLADFDHDGVIDLAIVNGRVSTGSKPVEEAPVAAFWKSFAERNQLFANDGGGRFRDISLSNAPFCGTAGVSRGLAWGDVDGDGAVDLLVTTVAGPARLYRNVAGRKGHWLMVRALDPARKRDAYGARVTVEAGSRRFVGLVNPGSSYLCSNDPRVHFGLGPAARVDAIRVLWPDGQAETFPGQEADRVITLRKGSGEPVKP